MVILTPLRRKVLRDLKRLWAQVLAIALVLAAGVSTLILGTGAYSSLNQTREVYYRTNHFADVFASVTRAPQALVAEAAAIDGVLAVEPRIVKLALLDMPDMAEPGSVELVSLPGELNRLHLRSGRLPDPQRPDEVAVFESFALAHGLAPGMRFAVVMNGQRRELTVVGLALSPEFIYALGPGEMMPDPRRFGIVWMPRASLEAAYDLEGAFSNLVLKLAPGASADRVIERLDLLLGAYGGTGATPRKDQISHAFLDAELRQLKAMSQVLPPIFLMVAAMLVNMTLARLIALEREQIGLLKALGYSARAIARHYVEFVLAIAVLGILIGFVAGTWLGAGMARLYARFFTFPFLVFTRDPDIYALAALVAVVAAVAGALGAVRSVLRLPPAVAMAPPAPPRYRQTFGGLVARMRALRQTTVMVFRHLLHRPLRTAASILGVAFAVSVLVGSQWAYGSIDLMIDVSFRRADRQDATVNFTDASPAAAAYGVAQLPAVLRTEPFRAVPVQIAHQNLSRKTTLVGKPADPSLSRLLSPDLRPMTVPADGLILSEALARAIDARPGDRVAVELLEGERRTVTLPVSGLSAGYLGLGAYMRIEGLNRLMHEGAVISGAHVLIDKRGQEAFFTAAKAVPRASFVTVKDLTLARFRQTIEENIMIMLTLYLTLAAVIAVGVVYNFARISLSEQGRELASLRVLGFSTREVAGVLFGEMAVIVALAQPLGWLIGYGFAVAMVAAFSSDLYQIPLVVNRDVYATASLVVLAAAFFSALLVRGRINRLDMIEVLKTRE
jgi:putative ABC transport system permease protein